MTKTKMKTRGKITIPISKTVIAEHHLKAGDILIIARITNGSLVLTPNEQKATTRVNGHSRNLKKSTKETDTDREEWMSFALAAWNSQFGNEEPEYTADMIKVPNPDYERR